MKSGQAFNPYLPSYEYIPDGNIPQVEVTSCGLNGGPMRGTGTYPARICCHLTGKKPAVFSHPVSMKMDYPFLTQDLPDIEPGSEEAIREEVTPVQYIRNMCDGAVAGYKYFAFPGGENEAEALERFVCVTELCNGIKTKGALTNHEDLSALLSDCVTIIRYFLFYFQVPASSLRAPSAAGRRG